MAIESAKERPVIKPLQAEQFLEAALEQIEPLRGTHIYDAIKEDYFKKTEQHDGGYGRWLQEVIPYFVRRYHLRERPRILDFGCGTGELTVLMNSLGFHATGIDVHERHLKLARVLARENNMPDSLFIASGEKRLPFDDKAFDIITMFVVLEHLDDSALDWLLPELRRICRGVVYVLVPNKLQFADDHTGLRFVPWLPHKLAALYIKARGKKYQYYISESGTWDVHYRSLRKVVVHFNKHHFDCDFLPDELVFPPLSMAPPIHRLNRLSEWLGTDFSLLFTLLQKWGYPKQHFYPFLNLACIPRSERIAI